MSLLALLLISLLMPVILCCRCCGCSAGAVEWCYPGVETAVGDPSKELERLEAAAKQREEAEEEADYRAVERGHVSAT